MNLSASTSACRAAPAVALLAASALAASFTIPIINGDVQ